MNEYLFSDIQIGMKESFQKEITIEMEDMFRYITGDENPLHKDDGYARLCMRGGVSETYCFRYAYSFIIFYNYRNVPAGEIQPYT